LDDLYEGGKPPWEVWKRLSVAPERAGPVPSSEAGLSNGRVQLRRERKTAPTDAPTELQWVST
jgi:hypothetical protein